MMGDKDDLDIVVFGAQEPDHPKIEAAGDIFFEFAHGAGDVHHGNDHGIRLVADRLLPRLEAQVFGANILELRLTLQGVPLDVLHDRPPLVDVRHDAVLADVGELYRLALDLLLALLLQVGQTQVLEDEGRQLVERDVRFVVVDPRLIAGLRPLSRLVPLLADDVADLRAALPLADAILLVVIEPEFVLFERADRDLDDRLAIRQDDVLPADDIGQVLLDRVLDLLVMPLLVDQPLAVERPVAFGNRSCRHARSSRRSGIQAFRRSGPTDPEYLNA